MTIRDYNRITGNKDYSDTTMSLGFRRYFMLPNKLKQAMFLKIFIENKEEGKNLPEDITTTAENQIKSMFEKMTEQEYKQWIVSH